MADTTQGRGGADARPMSMTQRAHLAGLTTVARHGPTHMARIGGKGREGLDRRIAQDAGIPEDAPDYAARLSAARRLYYSRLRSKRGAA